MKYSIEKLAGIDCIFAPMEEANSITLQIFCKAGSFYENKKKNGISHFLEHLFFKGGKKYPTPKAVAEAVDTFGGVFNAYTGDEEVSYYVKCAPQFALQALDVLTDMMIHAQFNAEELEREKGVVIQELKMYEDDPMSVAVEKWQTAYFGDNSYGRTTIGTIENINSFTADDLFAYKKSLYSKDNLIIVIAGKILDENAIKEVIETSFESLPEKKTLEREPFPGFLNEEESGFFEKGTEQNHLVISAPGFGGNDEQRYAARVLSQILGGNMSSRLFQNIREKQGLCYYIRASHWACEDFGTFVIRAGIDKERFEFGVGKIFEEIADIAKGNFSKEEFNNAISGMIGNIQMGIESSNQMAEFLGDQYLLYGKVESLEDVIQKYQNMQWEEVRNLAYKLERENLFLYYVK